MNYHHMNQHQQHQGVIKHYSAYRNYQQLPGYRGNATVEQQRHRHDAQGQLILAVSGTWEGPEQMIHRLACAQQQQQQPQPVVVPTTEEIETRPVASQHNPQKKRPRTSPYLRPTVPQSAADTQSINLPTAQTVDRISSGKERRRTQMRMAQRAYRQRKQNELSFRAKQLFERDGGISRIKTAFDLLQSRLVEADLLTIFPGLQGPMMEMERGFEALGQMATYSGSVLAVATVMENRQVDMSAIETGVFDPGQQRQWTSPDSGSDSPKPLDPLNRPTYSIYDTTAPTQIFDIPHQYPSTYQQYTNRSVPITTMN